MNWYKDEKTKRIGIVNKIVNSDINLYHQQEDYSCGCAAIRNVLKIIGYKHIPSEQALLKDMKTDPDSGTYLLELEKWIKENSIPCKHVSNAKEIELLLSHNKVILVLYQDFLEDIPDEIVKEKRAGHYALIVGYDNESYYFVDSATERQIKKIRKDNFLKRWESRNDEKTIVKHYGLAFPF